MARKRTQARRSGSSKSKTSAAGASRRAKTKTAGSRAKTKKTTSARAKTKTTTSRSKTKVAASRSKTATSRSRKTATARRPTRARSATTRLGSLDDVLKDQLGDLYSAERQLVRALPKVARAATHPALREALQNHLEETKGHVRRLEQIFSSRRMSTPSKKCKGMAGLIEEGDEVVAATGDEASKDAALIAAAQRVEHYEIAGYGTARTLADELGLDEARGLLDETLAEESNADGLLTKIATGGMFRSGINTQAAG